MSYFDRFDICEAYAVLEWDYHEGGILWERPSNSRKNMSTGFQLSRMKFKPHGNLCFDTLTDNGKEIYIEQVQKLNLPT